MRLLHPFAGRNHVHPHGIFTSMVHLASALAHDTVDISCMPASASLAAPGGLLEDGTVSCMPRDCWT